MFLQSMREKTQSVFAYIIVGFLILSFALWGVSSYLHGGFNNDTVAKVNGEKILYQAFSQSLNYYNQQQQLNLGANYNPNQQQQQMIKQLVLNNMIAHLAISQYVKKLGFAISSEQTDNALFSLPAFQKDGQFNPDYFRSYLASQGTSASEFINNFSDSLAITQWQEGINSTAFATQAELDEQVKLLRQKRDVVYATLSLTNLPDSNKQLPPITDKQIEQYYQLNKPLFTTPESVKINYIEVSLDDLIKQIHPSETDLKAYYRANINRYTQPEQWQVNIITVNNSNGDSTSEQAKPTSTTDLKSLAQKTAAALAKGQKISPDSQVKIAQKNIWLKADNISGVIKKSLLKNKQAGNVTEPLPVGQTNSINTSYVIYQVNKYQARVVKPFPEVKSQVNKAYIQTKATERYTALADKMTNISYEQPDSLTGVAQAVAKKIQTSTYFTRNDSEDDVGNIIANPKIINAAFSDDVLLGKNNSDLIKLDNNRLVVLRVADHKPSQEEPLSEVKSSIVNQLQKQLLADQLSKQAKTIEQALTNKPYQDVAKQFNIKFVHKKAIGRFSKLASDGVLQQAFSLNKNQTSIVELADGNQVILKVLAISPGDAQSITGKDKTMYQTMLTSEWNNAVLAQYSKAIVTAAKVKRNQTLLKQI